MIRFSNHDERGIIGEAAKYPLTRDGLVCLRTFGVLLLRRPRELYYGDCEDWVADYFRLPLFNYDCTRSDLFEPVTDLLSGLLVAYRRFDNNQYSHFGVSLRVDEQILVDSRWGIGGALFRHPLDKVPAVYGDHVDLYRFLEARSDDPYTDILSANI